MVDLDGGRFVDVAFVIRERLEELGLEQRDLARAARVTESYVSQLLTRKKAPPAPNRTDIYDRMDRFLKLPQGELAKVAELARKEDLKRTLGDAPQPLFPHLRNLILRKCRDETAKQVSAILERHRHAARARVPGAPAVPGPAPHRPLLLPGAPEPQRSVKLSVIVTTFTRFASPLGELVLTASDAALTGVYFPPLQEAAGWLEDDGHGPAGPVLAPTRQQLPEHFA